MTDTDTSRTTDPVLQEAPLGFQWPTIDPFLFCAHHRDDSPAGNAAPGPGSSAGGLGSLATGWAVRSASAATTIKPSASTPTAANSQGPRAGATAAGSAVADGVSAPGVIPAGGAARPTSAGRQAASALAGARVAG